jgi:hypothetical protein
MGGQTNPLLRHLSTLHGKLAANVTLSPGLVRSTSSSSCGWEVVLADQAALDL